MVNKTLNHLKAIEDGLFVIVLGKAKDLYNFK